MVRGLERFKAHFAPFAESYVLIGGTACSLAMEEAGLDFRATKDLDIVLCVEALDGAFVRAFWDFVHSGGYRVRETSTGKKQFYRFTVPADDTYPAMLELFSRAPDVLTMGTDQHLTPIPVDDAVVSLSAILLDDDYYAFIHAGKVRIAGLPVVAPEHLIPLKVKAWLDLDARRRAGGQVDQRDINKHKNDIFRLYRIVDPTRQVAVPLPIAEDLQLFFSYLEAGPDVDLRSLGLRNTTIGEILAQLRSSYGLAV